LLKVRPFSESHPVHIYYSGLETEYDGLQGGKALAAEGRRVVYVQVTRAGRRYNDIILRILYRYVNVDLDYGTKIKSLYVEKAHLSS